MVILKNPKEATTQLEQSRLQEHCQQVLAISLLGMYEAAARQNTRNDNGHVPLSHRVMAASRPIRSHWDNFIFSPAALFDSLGRQ